MNSTRQSAVRGRRPESAASGSDVAAGLRKRLSQPAITAAVVGAMVTAQRWHGTQDVGWPLLLGLVGIDSSPKSWTAIHPASSL